MYKLVLAMFLLSVVATAQAPQPSAAMPPASASDVAPAAAPVSSLPAMAVLFSVTDKSGNAVSGLTKEQVSIMDNGQSVQTVELQNAAELPLDLGILMLCDKKTFKEQQKAVADLVTRVFRTGKDRAFVLTGGCDKTEGQHSFDWESDPAALISKVEKLERSTGLPDAFGFSISIQSAGLNKMPIEQYFGSGYSFFEVAYTMMHRNARPARRALVVFRKALAHSQGTSERYSQNVERRMGEIIQASQVLGVPLYMIGIDEPEQIASAMTQSYGGQFSGVEDAARQRDERLDSYVRQNETAGRSNLDRLARESGGRIWWTRKKNYSDGIAAMANALQSQYIATFTPSVISSPGPARALKVTVSARDANVNAPTAYWMAQQK